MFWFVGVSVAGLLTSVTELSTSFAWLTASAFFSSSSSNRFKNLALANCRNIGKGDLIHNSYQPRIEVDSQTYGVRADGVLLTCEPAKVLPMAQRYFLF